MLDISVNLVKCTKQTRVRYDYVSQSPNKHKTTSLMIHNSCQGLLKRCPCLMSSPPDRVPPIILPLQRKALAAISEAHWMYGTMPAIITLPLQRIIISLHQKSLNDISAVNLIYGTAV